ncbi:uncharacterized protein LOC132314883 [Cornus florida]|uniref:uncharacterized protein LOC132314883 n=1 Tax=Cornus florida TaxID=4283 RepID=UPI00289D0321|nr:uncharacterized protein LOC132314883 [Cornus florida]
MSEPPLKTNTTTISLAFLPPLSLSSSLCSSLSGLSSPSMPASASSSPPWTAKMAPSTTTTTISSSSSTVTTTNSTATTTTSSLQVPFQLLEITLISAQDLAHVSKSMRTYAMAWVEPDRKFTTRPGQQGHANPTWNDKFVLKVDDQFLTSDNSAVMVEIYTTSWLRHTLVGTVRVLINNLIPPSTRSINNTSTRFVGLQIRRPSGTPQGILYLGVSILDTRNMKLACSSVGFCEIKNRDSVQPGDKAEEKNNNEGVKEDNDKKEEEEKKEEMNEKVQLWRSRSVGSEEDFPVKPDLVYNESTVNGSVCNSSMVNESELSSDVGPSASIVAAEIAKGSYPQQQKQLAEAKAGADETGSSIVEDLTVEEATAKGYKLKNESKRNERHSTDDHDLIVAKSNRGHPRRHSDGGGLFSCFGNAYGFEFTIVCGAPYSNNNNNNKNKKKRVGNNKNALSPPNDLNLRRSHRSA